MQKAISKQASEILTVMFTDIAGYTKTTSNLSRDQFHKMMDMFEDLSIPIIEQFEGRIIKKLGDAFLVTFKSPTDAVHCGIEMQKAFWYYNESMAWSTPLIVRVAIHTGEVMHRQGDVYGDAVNTASRIETVAPAGHVVFSDAVFAAMNKSEIPCIHIGLQKFKGVKFPVRLFRVKTKKDFTEEKRKAVKKFIKNAILLSAVGIIAIFVLRFLWFSGLF